MTSKTTERAACHSTTEWRQIGKCYVRFAVLTGVPSAALSTYLWTPKIILGWLYCLVVLPIIMSAITVIWGVTAYPFLLLLGLLSGRANAATAAADPDGPGVIICPFDTVPGSRSKVPDKKVSPRS